MIKIKHGNLPAKRRGRPVGSIKGKAAQIKGYIPAGEKEQLAQELKNEKLSESELLRDLTQLYLKLRVEYEDELKESGCTALDVMREHIFGLIYDKSRKDIKSILRNLGREKGKQ